MLSAVDGVPQVAVLVLGTLVLIAAAVGERQRHRRFRLLSSPALASQPPSRVTANERTALLWPSSTAVHLPECRSQIRMWWSLPALASQLPSGAMATDVTESVWPCRTARQERVAVSHRRTVWSSLPLASQVPSIARAVEAPGIAQLLHFPEELEDGDCRVFRAAGAQVVAVGVDERGLVAGCAAVAGGLLHAGVPLDGVQGDIEAAGAFEQADALAE